MIPGMQFRGVVWYRNGDHPDDDCRPLIDTVSGEQFLSEGKVVRYFRHPDVDGYVTCHECGCAFHDHGWIDAPGYDQEKATVCPGDLVADISDGTYRRYVVAKLKTSMPQVKQLVDGRHSASRVYVDTVNAQICS